MKVRASAYHKPPLAPLVTESTPLHNPYWQYSRNKAACEEILMRAWREQARREGRAIGGIGVAEIHGALGQHGAAGQEFQRRRIRCGFGLDKHRSSPPGFKGAGRAGPAPRP